MPRLAASLCFLFIGLAYAGCGGSDVQPAMPDVTVTDQSADEMGLAQPPHETVGGIDIAMQPVRLVAGTRSDIEGEAPTVRIVSPRANRTYRANGRIDLTVRVTDWELQPAPGRHIHVIVDNEPYIAVRDVSSTINLAELVEANLGQPLAGGTHVLRVFASRATHESVKTDGAFASVVFHVGQRTAGFSFDGDAPLLTYSRPKGCYTTGSSILLDFQVRGAELSADGMRVRYVIGGIEGSIVDWVPHTIENLPAGEHPIHLWLVDADGELVPGPFNDTTRDVTVADSCD